MRCELWVCDVSVKYYEVSDEDEDRKINKIEFKNWDKQWKGILNFNFIKNLRGVSSKTKDTWITKLFVQSKMIFKYHEIFSFTNKLSM